MFIKKHYHPKFTNINILQAEERSPLLFASQKRGIASAFCYLPLRWRLATGDRWLNDGGENDYDYAQYGSGGSLNPHTLPLVFRFLPLCEKHRVLLILL